MVRRGLALFALLALTIPLAGCFEEKVYTVEEFKADPERMAKVNAECNNNPGEAIKKPNCLNAAQAKFHADMERQGAAFKKGIKW